MKDQKSKQIISFFSYDCDFVQASINIIANPTWQKICLWCQSFSIDKTGQVFVDRRNCGSRCLPYSDLNQGHNDVICVFTIWRYTGHLVLCCQACQGREKTDWLSVFVTMRGIITWRGVCVWLHRACDCVWLCPPLCDLLDYKDYQEREREMKSERKTAMLNSKTLILKDSSIRSSWNYLTASRCYTTNTNKHDYTKNMHQHK